MSRVDARLERAPTLRVGVLALEGSMLSSLASAGDTPFAVDVAAITPRT